MASTWQLQALTVKSTDGFPHESFRPFCSTVSALTCSINYRLTISQMSSRDGNRQPQITISVMLRKHDWLWSSNRTPVVVPMVFPQQIPALCIWSLCEELFTKQQINAAHRPAAISTLRRHQLCQQNKGCVLLCSFFADTLVPTKAYCTANLSKSGFLMCPFFQ